MTVTNLLGVYKVDGQRDVHLIELKINAKPSDIKIEEFTQPQVGIGRLDWQSPWDEKFLNDEGVEIIGDWINLPEDLVDKTRLAFFFHFLDFKKPLITPFGEVDLKNEESMPDRLSSMISYEKPD